MKLLIGSTFPLSLIRRAVCIEPKRMNELISRISSADRIYSFWGHSNTLNAVNDLLGCDISPDVQRPSIMLNNDKFPILNGQVFSECWVISPDYVEGFRPAIGVEVKPEQITGWQILKIDWDRGKMQ